MKARNCAVNSASSSMMNLLMLLQLFISPIANGSENNQIDSIGIPTIVDLEIGGNTDFIKQETQLNNPYLDHQDRYWTTITVDTKDYYPEALEKQNILMVGEDIVIDETVDSFGGDVVIFAKNLILNAPIDTRPKVNYSAPFWLSGKITKTAVEKDFAPFGGGLIREGSVKFGEGYTIDIFGLLPKHKNFIDTFYDYYYWHDYFDESCKCYKYKSFDSSEVNRDVDKGKLVLPYPIPVMPYGLMTEPDPRLPAISGADAPSPLDIKKFKSGNITIFANNIEFCEECAIDSFEAQPVIGGDPYDVQKKMMFNASGLKGGRGALGSTHKCWPNPLGGKFKIVCSKEHDVAGGTSGNPSRGGDAGNISVNIYDNFELTKKQISAAKAYSECLKDNSCDENLNVLRKSISALSDISGGMPSNNSLAQMPSYNNMLKNHKHGRAIFNNVLENEPDIKDKIGAEGALTIKNISVGSAISSLISLSNSFDSAKGESTTMKLGWISNCILKKRVNNSIQISEVDSHLDTCRYVSESQTSLNSRDVVTNFLFRTLSNRQDALLRSINAKHFDSLGALELIDDALKSYSCREFSIIGYTLKEKSILSRLCRFRVPEGFPENDIIQSYLFHSGGLLMPVNTITTGDKGLTDLSRLSIEANKNLIQILGELKESRRLYFGEISERKKNDYLLKISNLEKSIHDLEKKLRDMRGTFGFIESAADILSGATKGFKSAKESYKSLDYENMIEGIQTGGEAVIVFFEFLSTNKSNEVALQLNQVKEELLSVRLELAKFEVYVQRYNRDISVGVEKLGVDYLRYLEQFERIDDVTLFIFENSIKEILIGKLSDPYAGDSRLGASVNSLLQRFDSTNSSSVTTSALPFECLSGDFKFYNSLPKNSTLSCVIFPSSNTPSVFIDSRLGEFKNYPILVIDKGHTQYPINLFSLFNKKDLIKSTDQGDVRSVMGTRDFSVVVKKKQIEWSR